MKNKKLAGAIIATAVAGLFLSGSGLAKEKAAKGAGAGKVKCVGINSCAGKGSCDGAGNACKGKNSCQGKGWKEVKSEKECKKMGGKVKGGK